jgi:hypothetical protein
VFPPTNGIVNRILDGNGALRSLTVNCSLLDDSAAAAIAKGSLRELELLKCSSFTPYLFAVIGERCANLRYALQHLAIIFFEDIGLDAMNCCLALLLIFVYASSRCDGHWGFSFVHLYILFCSNDWF